MSCNSINYILLVELWPKFLSLAGDVDLRHIVQIRVRVHQGPHHLEMLILNLDSRPTQPVFYTSFGALREGRSMRLATTPK